MRVNDPNMEWRLCESGALSSKMATKMGGGSEDMMEDADEAAECGKNLETNDRKELSSFCDEMTG